jgi:transposase
MGGARVIKIDQARLAELVAQRPDATTRELHESLGVACSESAVGLALQRLGLSFKKRRSMHPSRTARTWPSSDDDGDATSVMPTHAD